jgi:hypothetical protein
VTTCLLVVVVRGTLSSLRSDKMKAGFILFMETMSSLPLMSILNTLSPLARTLCGPEYAGVKEPRDASSRKKM